MKKGSSTLGNAITGFVIGEDITKLSMDGYCICRLKAADWVFMFPPCKMTTDIPLDDAPFTV